VNWHEWALSIPAMPGDENEAREAYARLVAQIETDVDEKDRELALSALGDTWGEAARFNGWQLEKDTNDDTQT
jgi:hypothetical protein